MAIGTKSDFVIYHEQFFAGMVEVAEQFADAFNSASLNTIRMLSARKRGDYEQESFIQKVAGLVTRRDVTSVASATDLKLEQDEHIRVKVNRKIGPVAQTHDAWRKIARDPGEFSLLLGRQMGPDVVLDHLNTGLIALDAALSGVAAVNHNALGTADETTTHKNLVRGLKKFGDRGSRIVAWVMHSVPFYDLMLNTITENVFGVAGLTIVNGTAASLGRPIIVTDSAALIDEDVPSSAQDTYHILGLTADALLVEDTEEREIVADLVTGNENIATRIQGEYAFNVGVKGFKWDVGNGGANPTDGALGTSSNWDQVAADTKSLAGVRISVRAAT